MPPLTPDADHDIVFIDVNTRATVPKKKPSTKFLYDKADWDSMKVSMDNYCLPQKPVQEQWNHLENFLQNLMRKYIPSKVSRPQKHKPWITRELITDTHRRDRALLPGREPNPKLLTKPSPHSTPYVRIKSEKPIVIT